MAKSRSEAVVIRIDEDSKAFLVRAAARRHMSLSDYVYHVALAQAQKDLAPVSGHAITLSPDEQLAFWNALNAPVVLTHAQVQLGRLMRAEQLEDFE